MESKTDEMTQLLSNAKVGSRVWFAEEKQGYTVQARSDRYIVCTKPFNAKRTVLYTIIDLEEQVRGTENLVFGAGFETKSECDAAILRLQGQDRCEATEVSYRNRIPLNISNILESK